jgi:hypothetical protein
MNEWMDEFIISASKERITKALLLGGGVNCNKSALKHCMDHDVVPTEEDSKQQSSVTKGSSRPGLLLQHCPQNKLPNEPSSNKSLIELLRFLSACERLGNSAQFSM